MIKQLEQQAMSNAPSPVIFDLSGKKVFVAGHRGMVGSALVRRLEQTGCEIVTAGRDVADLRRQDATDAFLAAHKPDAVIVAAAIVGGIQANATRPAEFLYDNLAIEANLIHGAYKAGVSKLMFLGSSCMFPKLADQPLVEDSILTGPLEPTNQWYAIAKIAGMMLCQAYRRQYGCDFITAIPTGLFGIGDNFDPAASHVIPGQIRKMHDAKLNQLPTVDIWGTGAPEREFMYIDDAADGLVFLMERYSGEEPVNVAGGETVTIRRLVELVREVCGWQGEFVFDTTKPDGMPRKALDGQRLTSMGWTPGIGVAEGLARTYKWFLDGNGVRLGN
jgi:GDP-L-fucose synthase